MFVHPEGDLFLRAEFTTFADERFKGGDPSDYIAKIEGRLLIVGDDDSDTQVGSMSGHYVDLANGNIGDAEHSVFDHFDCHSDEYMDAWSAIFHPETGEYWDEFEDATALGFNVLLIDEMKIDREDGHIALRFLKLIVDTHAHGAGIVVAFKHSGIPEQALHALEFFPSPRAPGVFILNRAAPFKGAVPGRQPAAEDSAAS